MKSEMRVKVLVAAVALPMGMLTAYAVADGPSDGLATPESFSTIGDTATRSAALFTELGKVLTHPRCVNCHPAGDRPHQGELGRDPARNGGRSLEALVDHIGTDHLVVWAWAPGFGRRPAPGTQKQAGALVEAWVKTGAACPK